MRKFAPSASKAHSPLPTPSDAQLGQEVEAHPLWEHLRTFRAMLSEAEEGPAEGRAPVGCRAHAFLELSSSAHSSGEKKYIFIYV